MRIDTLTLPPPPTTSFESSDRVVCRYTYTKYVFGVQFWRSIMFTHPENLFFLPFFSTLVVS